MAALSLSFATALSPIEGVLLVQFVEAIVRITNLAVLRIHWISSFATHFRFFFQSAKISFEIRDLP